MMDAVAFLFIAILCGVTAVLDYRDDLTKSAAWCAAGAIVTFGASILSVVKVLP